MTLDCWILKGLFVLLIATASEALFFEYPKNGLTEFLQSLREKKENLKKLTKEDVHHYHLHYYPVPFVIEKEVKIPERHGHIEPLQREESGWTDHSYHLDPEPTMLREHQEWPREPESRGLSVEDQLDIAAVSQRVAAHRLLQQPRHVEPPPPIVEHRHHLALVHLPVQHDIVVRHSTVTEERKKKKEVHPLVSFFRKLQRIKNSIFEKEEHEGGEEDEVESTIAVTSRLNLGQFYGIYFHPKSLHRI